MKKIVMIDQEKCTGCGNCVSICPQNILYIDSDSNTCKVTDEYKCDRLSGCVSVCPVDAVKINV
ncbi:MAG: 4Fe-4S dicluster domain-containing protein [bacterium]|nr:4Fe-4S dicluster domain-containing protein [bacterium]